MTNEIKDLNIEAPGRDDPGFLRRTRRALELAESLKASDPSPRLLDDLVEFVLPYVVKPKDRKAAEEALLDLSQNEFDKIMDAIAGKEHEPPPQKGGDSEES